MEKINRHEVIFYIIQGVLIIVAIYVISWLPTQILLNKSQQEVIKKLGQDPDVVDKHIKSAFNKMQLPIPKTNTLTIESPDPDKISQLLYKDLIESGVEAYVSHSDQQSQMRIYDVNQLRYRIQFVPESTEQIIADLDSNKVKLAIVFSNVGDSDIQKIIDISEPISVAIKPYTPFALRIAKKAALHWHEVLMDLREIENPEWDVLPFYSAILTHQLYAPPSKYILQLFPSNYIPTEQNKGLRSGIAGVGASARSTLQRGLQKSLNQGQAVIIIDANDPEVEVVLDWIAHRDNDIIQLVFLSEIAYLSL
jgi:hypothetical protein